MRTPVTAVLVILAAAALPSRSRPAAKDQILPQEMAGISRFTGDVRQDSQGRWEAKLGNGIVMVYVPAGGFLMGSSAGEWGRERDEGPVHRVFVKGIWIGKFEVTRELWQEVMGADRPGPADAELPQGDVTYEDVQRFLLRLKGNSGLDFRLPTEAEWEKCCRGGIADPGYGPLDEIAWHAGNSGGRAHPVGTKRPNAFGLHDMLGNVWEWCSDWYGGSFYEVSAATDPKGPDRGKRRVCRGGGFLHGGNYLRSSHRNSQVPDRSRPYLGFRLVLDLPR